MTKTVYKYSLRVDDEQVVLLPRDAELLTIQVQHGQPVLWALVDPTRIEEPRKISIRGTGHDAPGVGRYISTFQMYGGELAFHAFEG
jgi:hypothetical protein